MILEFQDIVITDEETYIVTGHLQGKEMPKNTKTIKRNGIIIYDRDKEK